MNFEYRTAPSTRHKNICKQNSMNVRVLECDIYSSNVTENAYHLPNQAPFIVTHFDQTVLIRYIMAVANYYYNPLQASKN